MGAGIVTPRHNSGGSNELQNYRPISLLNTVYTIWAEISALYSISINNSFKMKRNDASHLAYPVHLAE